MLAPAHRGLAQDPQGPSTGNWDQRTRIRKAGLTSHIRSTVPSFLLSFPRVPCASGATFMNICCGSPTRVNAYYSLTRGAQQQESLIGPPPKTIQNILKITFLLIFCGVFVTHSPLLLHSRLRPTAGGSV